MGKSDKKSKEILEKLDNLRKTEGKYENIPLVRTVEKNEYMYTMKSVNALHENTYKNMKILKEPKILRFAIHKKNGFLYCNQIHKFKYKFK